jgi:hypothetical protein
MPTEVLGFQDKEMRNEQYRKWKAEGSKGITRYSTHQGNDPHIVWVVTRREPDAVESIEKKEVKDGN